MLHNEPEKRGDRGNQAYPGRKYSLSGCLANGGFTEYPFVQPERREFPSIDGNE